MLLVVGIVGGVCINHQNIKLKKVKVNLCEAGHSILYAPQYVAISQGLFAEEGIVIKMSTEPDTNKMMSNLLSENTDIGLAGAEAIIYGYREEQDDYIIN